MITLIRNLTKFPMNKNIRNLSLTNINKKITYTANEEWYYHADDYIKIGITKKAIEQLSDVVYVDFNYEVGDIIKLNKEIVSIESVKATEGINIDSDCILLENNENLAENLDNLNNDPENVETGYLVKIKKKD